MEALILFFLIFPFFCFLCVCLRNCEEQDREHEAREQEGRIQQQQSEITRQQPADDAKDTVEHEETIHYRSYTGHVLKSVNYPNREASDEANEDHECATDCDYPTNEPALTFLQKDAGTTESVSPNGGVLLSVDFGDSEVLPLEELSCPICLVDYEHGDTIQRSAAACCYSYNESNSTTTATTANDTIQQSAVAATQCEHIFHQNCITQWIQSNIKNECPICRRFFVTKHTHL